MKIRFEGNGPNSAPFSTPSRSRTQTVHHLILKWIFFLHSDKRLNQTQIQLQLMQCLLFVWHSYAFLWQIKKCLGWKCDSVCILAYGLFQTKSCLLGRLDAYLILADLFGKGMHGYFSQQSQSINTGSVWFKYPFENKKSELGFSACYCQLSLHWAIILTHKILCE